MKIKLSIIILLLAYARVGSAQAYFESDWLTRMDQGANLMYEGKYETADSIFQVVLKNLKVLPAELAFYFGRNSFYVGKYKQSINWLNKYIELKGTKGQYFDETISLLEVANIKFTPIRESEITSILTELTKENLIDCPSGKRMCPVCKGSGVLIKKGVFDANYQTCPYSGGSGYLSCDDYNLFLRGELAPKSE
jgi:tetratricopeptide (TPR) repeat protein